jgi:threonine dehydratase
VTLAAPTIEQVRAAHERINGRALRTPLIPIHAGGVVAHLKAENLQPIGSFKIRGALNKMLSVPPDALKDGAYTASAGNMAQGVAFAAQLLRVPARVFVPDSAPTAKTDNVERLGGTVTRVPYNEWWQIMQDRGRAGTPGLFVHPFSDSAVMAGNGTIAEEIVEDCADVDAVIVPWGGGGLTCGIAAAMKAIKPDCRVYACEAEGAAPLSAARAAGAPVQIDPKRSFVDGMGGRGVFPEIWPLAQSLVAGVLEVSVKEIAEAVEMIVRLTRMVPEGAGAAPLAALIRHAENLTPRPSKIVCVVSGGNIDQSVLAKILMGQAP